MHKSMQKKDFTETALDLNIKMVWVDGGEFMMGGTEEQEAETLSNDHVIRRVKLDSYYIGECEITQEQWTKVMVTSVWQQCSLWRCWRGMTAFRQDLRADRFGLPSRP